MSEADRDAILKELHNSDSEGSDDEDIGLDLAKMKKSPEAVKSAEKPKENPLDEEEKRHKDNLMQDIYDQISDEEDDETPKAQEDNPFKEQMIQEAKELKEKKANELLDPNTLTRK
jgi:hypothetical protein